LSGVIGAMTSNIFSNIFPGNIGDILSSIFNLNEKSDFIQHIQEIIDTIDNGAKTITDDRPKFNPLSKEKDIPFQMINAIGLRELESM